MDPVVETSGGRLRGRSETGVLLFLGVPYASPPVGTLRFCPPRPVQPWSGVREALRSGPPAPQVPGPLARLIDGGAGDAASEDCLTLNVTTPAADAGRRPVLVWIHGGGFTTGSGGSPIYSGLDLVRRGDVVVVTVSYRLGALGFLALPALAREEGALGNLGLRDQVLALEWVRENVAAFGGDPENVTLFGESAGAMSAATLLSVPAARGLFRRAILESGATRNVSSPEVAARVARAFSDELGVAADDPDLPATLRRAPVDALLAAQTRTLARVWRKVPGLAFQPVCDGAWLPRPPLEAIRAGAARDVSLVVGTNLDEYKLYRPTDPRVESLDDAALARRLGHWLPDGEPGARRVISAYREARGAGEPVDPTELWFAIETDRLFRIPALRLAAAQLVHQPGTFVYLFTWASPALEGKLGACHALEVPFVFGSHRLPALKVFVGEGAAVERLSATIQEAWLAFARSGAPACEALPEWPAYELAQRPTQLLGAESGLAFDPRGEERRIWDELG